MGSQTTSLGPLAESTPRLLSTCCAMDRPSRCRRGGVPDAPSRVIHPRVAIYPVATCRDIRFSDVLQGFRSEINPQIALIFCRAALFGWIRSITLRRDVQGRHEIELDVGERCKAPRSERSKADLATASQLVRVALRGAKPRLTDPSARRMGGDPGRW